MIRSLFLLAAAFFLMGGSCNPPLVCSNALDGTEFGFTLTAPDDFDCTLSFPATGLIQGLVTYQQTGTTVQLIVFVGDPSSADQLDDGTTSDDCNDIGTITTANGIQFERCMAAGVDDNNQPNVSYAASTDLPVNGSILLIILASAEADGGDLENMLNAILETVAFP